VLQAELYHNAEGKVYCLLEGPDEEAIRKHHAARSALWRCAPGRRPDLTRTSTRRPGGATVEVARRQPDGSWRWVIGHPALLS
jgi:hypothetical protein